MAKSLIDIHCHILPGVDDGAPDMETALSMLRKEVNDGVNQIILTPHFFSYGKNSSHLKERFEELQKAAQSEFPELTLHLGQELFYSSDLPELLEQGKALYLGSSRYVLVEFSPRSDFNLLYRSLTDLLQNGIQPIIAHAERLKVLNPDAAAELVHCGVYLQINAGSIYGKSGFSTKRRVAKLIRNNLVHFVGSDAHNLDRRAPNMGQAYTYTIQKFGRKTAKSIFVEHPKQLLQDNYL